MWTKFWALNLNQLERSRTYKRADFIVASNMSRKILNRMIQTDTAKKPRKYLRESCFMLLGMWKVANTMKAKATTSQRRRWLRASTAIFGACRGRQTRGRVTGSAETRAGMTEPNSLYSSLDWNSEIWASEPSTREILSRTVHATQLIDAVNCGLVPKSLRAMLSLPY